MKIKRQKLIQILLELEQEKAETAIGTLSSFYTAIAETDGDDLDEKEEHAEETMDTAVMGKGMLYKGKRMKTPSGLSYGLDYTGAGVDEGRKMKVTKRQLRQIIREALDEGKCDKASGHEGCVRKRAKGWVVLSNKTGKPWRGGGEKDGDIVYYDSEAAAKKALGAYHG